LVVVVIVLPASYACCSVTLFAFAVQVAIWFEPFRHSEVEPAEPSVVTARVELKVPAPVTPSVPPRFVVPVPTVKVFVPVTEVAPLRLTLPVPVEKVFAPV